MKLKVLSLFDGISCGRVALKRAGIEVECYDAYEIEEDAIKIAKHNWNDVTEKGNVYDAKYNEGQYDLLIGGSPCTYWSIAQKADKRETTSSGIGFELFMQYYRALIEVKPKYFIYENNASIHENIKKEITKYLGVEPVQINSALVSAQNRKRMYWTNIHFNMPKDKNILLQDVCNFDLLNFKPVGDWAYKEWGGKPKIEMLKDIHSKKSSTLTTSKTHPMNYYLNDDKTMYANLPIEVWEKLQTLPVGYCGNVNVKETSKFKAIGNGVDSGCHNRNFKRYSKRKHRTYL